MGKKRIAVVSEETKQKLVKSGKQHGRITDVAAEALAEAAVIEEKAKKLEGEIKKKKETKIIEPVKKKAAKTRGQRYQEARKKIKPDKFYPLPDAIKLLKTVSISSFNGSVDVHLIVRKTGISGEVEFPHPIGKKQTFRVADETLLKELEKGKINFTGLVATPTIMPKLAKYAKLLGPRGLMPNPKAGTVSDKPEEVIKRLTSITQFKTETKAPLIHLTVGKVDSPEKNLEENFQALITAVGRRNIKKTVLAPSMGPGIKVKLG